MPALNVKENGFQDRFVEHLRSKHCFVKPLVASALMSGMPDLFIRSKYGVQFTVENKVWRNKTAPKTPQCIMKLLDKEQGVTIVADLWRYHAFCPIIAFIETQPDYCHWTDGMRLYLGEEWITLANKLAGLQYAIQT